MLTGSRNGNSVRSAAMLMKWQKFLRTLKWRITMMPSTSHGRWKNTCTPIKKRILLLRNPRNYDGITLSGSGKNVTKMTLLPVHKVVLFMNNGSGGIGIGRIV
jgi:hypothetical protein